MADNSSQTGADTIATDDLATLNGGAVSGVKAQRVKVGYGDDSIFRDVSAAFPLPVVRAVDSGRNPVAYYMLIPVLATATDTLQSLTGTKGGATVTATATPAVVTTGKTFRIQRFWATYVATATTGYGIVRLRYNPSGVVAVTSPVLQEIAVGAATPATANASGSEDASIPDGLEVPAGAGVGISVQGFAAATAAAVGYILAGVSGYEY